MSWKEERKEEIEALWKERSAFGFATICQTCGGGSISTCKCAYQLFLDNLDSPEALNKMLQEKEEREKIWNKRK